MSPDVVGGSYLKKKNHYRPTPSFCKSETELQGCVLTGVHHLAHTQGCPCPCTEPQAPWRTQPIQACLKNSDA